MDELGIPELSTEQIEALCETAENAARKHILSNISSKNVERFDISVEAEGSKPLGVTVEIDLQLTTETRDVDVEELVNGATAAAHKAVENFLRKVK